MESVLITGANRGIGLEFVKQFAEDGWQVFACCRRPESADQLKALAVQFSNITVRPLDVTSAEQVNNLSDELSAESIDVLINNAGYYGRKGGSLDQINTEDWMEVLKVNTIAPLVVSRAFISQLAKSQRKLIVIVSSKMGSLSDNTSGGSYLYRTSKAGANQIGKSLAVDLADKSIGVLLFHPGWVQTDMGGANALIDTQTSVSGMVQQIKNFDQTKSGAFFAYDGQEVPW